MHERQPETETAVLPGCAGLSLPERLEQIRDERRIDAISAVRDGEFGHILLSAQGHADFSAFGRELERVRQEVADDLFNAWSISPDLEILWAGIQPERDAARIGKIA